MITDENALPAIVPMPRAPSRGPEAGTSSAMSAGSNDLLQRKARRPQDLGEEVSLRAPNQRLPSPRRWVSYPPASDEEFVNVKRLCASVIKGHQKLSKRMDDFTRSAVEAAEASEEGLMWVLQSELVRRDDATSSALAEWQESVLKHVDESVSQGLTDVVDMTKEREETILRRLSLLEQQVRAYEMFRSFEVDPPPMLHVPRRKKGKDWQVPLLAASLSTAPSSDAESRTASTVLTASERDGGSLDDSWTMWDAPPSLLRIHAVEKEDQLGSKPSLFGWALDDGGSDGAPQGWPRRCAFEDEDLDEARSLLSDDDDDDDSIGNFTVSVLPLDFRAHASRPSLRHQHRTRNQQARHVHQANSQQQRPPNSCLLWLPPLHRWFGAGMHGPRKFR